MAKIVINKSHYFHNLKIIVKKAGSINKVAVVLKDNAYGHGLIQIAKLAKEFGIKNAVVRTYAEALQIESYFEQILILADVNQDSYSHTFHIVINDIKDIAKLPKNTNVHLKIDTGMHRNGIELNSLEEAIYGVYNKKLNLKGVMTHFRSADELSCELFWQKTLFEQVKKKVKILCEKLFIPIPAFHSANSSALFRFKNFDEDMVRVGIAQYGYIETNQIFDNPNLKPILSLWASKISTRKISKNQKVGYGGTYTCNKDLIISTYDIGYGDGFLRLDGKKKVFTKNGSEIIGRVSMDNISVISDDEQLCIFDNAKELAKIHNTISYEIITTLNPQIPREIKQC